MNSFKPIRYDRKARKGWLIRLVISGVFIALFTIFTLIDSLLDVDTFIIIFAILVAALYVSIPLFVISLLFYIDSSIYLRRLSKNYYEVPEDKKLYDRDLAKLPRTGQVENVYVNDSKIGALISLICYIAFVIVDIYYVVKWTGLGESNSVFLFVIMMLAHLLLVIFAVVLYKQKDTSQYVDEVDVKAYRKTRISITRTISILVIMSLIFSVGVMFAFTMTDYIYKSRHGHYDKTTDDFKANATMKVISEDLQDGKWNDRITNTEKGENLSPELHFDKVEGADYYFIYMVDETANNWVHWVATDVRVEELATGANKKEYKDNPDFRYIGPYPPEGSGEHEYTIYVYAMRGKPDSDYKPEFDENSLSADYMYYDYLSISKRGKPNEYGNVIAYGYISGTYSR